MKTLFLIATLMLILVSSNQSSPSAVIITDDLPLCPVHKERMIHERIRIRYGSIDPLVFDEKTVEGRAYTKLLKEYLVAKKEQFPETRRWINGGCNVGAKEWAINNFCKTCRRREDGWLAKHPTFQKKDLLP